MSEQLKTRNGITPAALSAPQHSEDEMTIDLVDLFYRLLANWKLIVLLALVFAIGAGVYTIYFVTPQYSATGPMSVNSASPNTSGIITKNPMQKRQTTIVRFQ